MADQNKSEGPVRSESEKLACHLVSLPTILLTRIDVNGLKTFKTKNVSNKKSLTNISLKKKKPILPVKPVAKILSPNKTVGRPRGRPRKDASSKQKTPEPLKKSSKAESKMKTNKAVNKQKIIYKPESNTAKNILKKTMLQKKSKIVIPQTKKTKSVIPHSKKAKLVKKINSKQTAQKLIKIDKQTKKKSMEISKKISQKVIRNSKEPSKKFDKNIKQTQQKLVKSVNKNTPQKVFEPSVPETINKLPTKEFANTDSSEDEFLYDELIDEFENTFSKSNKSSEKTTNITLKPSTGNKPPTIVKGGIIKIDNLPADLKTIASPGQQPPKNKVIETSSHKKTKLPHTDSPVPPKKASPWPISMSTPPKVSNNASPNKSKKRNVSNTTTNTPLKPKITEKLHQNLSSATSNKLTNIKGGNDCLVIETQPNLTKPKKHKIGPKGATKKDPLYQSLEDEDNLSDEYTEVETLENLDYNVDDTFPISEPVKNNPKKLDNNTFENTTATSFNSIKDDEDPNIDLLRILTDESDDCIQNQHENPKKATTDINQSSVNEKRYNQTGTFDIENKTVNGMSSTDDSIKDRQASDEPKVRTIYDLISEVSIQRPSWNLHILPETNAFCIAQVTKGRLGLPTLKKCIELDPEDYNAKVYIHQYHIKRFDGIYDSEETILGLIEEIDSIKA